MKLTNLDKFTNALQAIAARQIRETMLRMTASEILAGRKLDLSAWPGKMVEALRPFLLKEQRVGMREALLEHQGHLSGRRIDVREIQGRMIAAADAMVATFAAESLSKIEAEANDVLKKIRRKLKAGRLTGHQARALLANQLKTTLGDPRRAEVTAAYQGHAAAQAGKQMLATEFGVRSKTWVCMFGPNCCKVCRKLHGKTVGLDEPFIVLPGGGPYAVVMNPPLHPSCFCTAKQGYKPAKPRKKSWEEIEIQRFLRLCPIS